jgi:protein-disulfide isomerase
MSSKSGKKPDKDNFTRNLVIGMVALVAAILVMPTLIVPLVTNAINPREISQTIPAVASADNGYAISFNTELTGVPVVDIYEDFQCPVCLEFESVNMKYIESLITEKKATVHYHILSFLGDESVRAANASACAADEGKFMQFHNGLYANQPQAENSGEWSNDRLIAIGATAGISSDAFKNCVNDLGYEGWVAKSAEAASKANINATPTVLVNGKEINRQTDYMSAANFKAAVEG